MWNSIGNALVAAALAFLLALHGASLEMSLLTGIAAGCFLMLWDIGRYLRDILARQTR